MRQKGDLQYAVGAVLFNDRGDVLLSQEAFHPHRGHWYLPCGKVRPNETLVVSHVIFKDKYTVYVTFASKC